MKAVCRVLLRASEYNDIPSIQTEIGHINIIYDRDPLGSNVPCAQDQDLTEHSHM
jgi:hypothetical protein